MTEQKKKTLSCFFEKALSEHPWPSDEHDTDRQINFCEILVNQYQAYQLNSKEFLDGRNGDCLLAKIAKTYTAYAAEFSAADSRASAVTVRGTIEKLYLLALKHKQQLEIKLNQELREQRVQEDRIFDEANAAESTSG